MTPQTGTSKRCTKSCTRSQPSLTALAKHMHVSPPKKAFPMVMNLQEIPCFFYLFYSLRCERLKSSTREGPEVYLGNHREKVFSFGLDLVNCWCTWMCQEVRINA